MRGVWVSSRFEEESCGEGFEHYVSRRWSEASCSSGTAPYVEQNSGCTGCEGREERASRIPYLYSTLQLAQNGSYVRRSAESRWCEDSWRGALLECANTQQCCLVRRRLSRELQDGDVHKQAVERQVDIRIGS